MANYGATTLSGITANTALLIGTVDRNMSIYRWTMTFNLTAGPNDGANFWTVRLVYGGFGVLAQFTTVGHPFGAGVWSQATTTSFAATNLTANGRYLYIDILKTGAPGAINLTHPAIEVYEQ
jgi:hypothetical protein